ncbi:T9SS type A sorting domain-containing protein [Aureispira sp. CCB-E]|uniref:T9SS type A sorting domain-containing protein n=1 Tax=Aureispira sp. CCB-E TaxID=3051121 RepID=UPI002868471B|nr:T9SS type A sorting domain-containing protein [Aureispira sp. CCB-E]WMX15317.1 T9SS type A sorting domain-containing protein [Aureispira sp. CCB-E]
MKTPFFTLLVAFFLLASSNVNASHLSGAEFRFEHVNGNDYIVSLYIYRDCNGINVPSIVTVNMESINCGINNNITLLQTSGPTVVTTIPGSQTTCMGGMVQGYEEYVYSDTITFPAQCTDWYFNWNSCCRNSAITNLVNPGSASMYIESTFDNTIVNNSPTYFIDPIFYGSMGANFSVALGGFDVDGDQLLFSLAAPADGANSSVAFASGLSAAQPLDILAGSTVSFSSTTGQFNCVLASGSQIVVFDVIVEEWRNGQKIAEHRRSLQILPINLGNNSQMLAPPTVGNPTNGTVVDAYTLEYNTPGQAFGFSMLFNDQDANDVITYNAAYSTLETIFPNAQVTSSNPNGNLNELELSISIPNPKPTLFSIVIEENNYLQQSFSYELRDANATHVDNLENPFTNVRIYPNPVDKTTTFEVPDMIYKKLELNVFDMTGQVVQTQVKAGTNVLEFNRGDLPAGVYSFQLKGDGKMVNTGLLQLK